MTISEFKAWLDGYLLAINNENPTPAQWEVIKEKLAELKEKPFNDYFTRLYNNYYVEVIDPYSYYQNPISSVPPFTLKSGTIITN